MSLISSITWYTISLLNGNTVRPGENFVNPGLFVYLFTRDASVLSVFSDGEM